MLFNTVRRMTDLNLTFLPISKITIRTGYSQNISQGPSYSSVHFGTQGLLLQNWRESTDNWLGALDWKPFSKTMFTYEQHVTHYKGNTSWQLGPVGLQLSNGAPVSLGFDNVSVPSCTGSAILNSATNPPTANDTCNGYLQYTRYSPTRAIFPTEEFRFLSSNIKQHSNERTHSLHGCEYEPAAIQRIFQRLYVAIIIARIHGYGLLDGKANRSFGRLRCCVADIGKVQSFRSVRFLGLPSAGIQLHIRGRPNPGPLCS